MNFQKLVTPLAAAALLTGASIGFAHAATPAPGSGSAGTVEGRVEGSTNSNAMGEPVKTAKTKPMKHKGKHTNAATGSGSAGTVEGRVAGSTNSNSKGEPAKVQ